MIVAEYYTNKHGGWGHLKPIKIILCGAHGSKHRLIKIHQSFCSDFFVNATVLISGQYFQLAIKYIRLFTVFLFLNLKLTLTSGQEAEVKSQSGHLKVFASKCALLWFSISERPWKDSMHIRQENLLVFKLGEPTVEGEAGVSLLSWWKIGTVRERLYIYIFKTKNFKMASLVTSTCWRTPSDRVEVR